MHDRRAEPPGYLRVIESFDPGWSATIDGPRTEISPANDALLAVHVAPGQHTIRFTYRTPRASRRGHLTAQPRASDRADARCAKLLASLRERLVGTSLATLNPRRALHQRRVGIRLRPAKIENISVNSSDSGMPEFSKRDIFGHFETLEEVAKTRSGRRDARKRIVGFFVFPCAAAGVVAAQRKARRTAFAC